MLVWNYEIRDSEGLHARPSSKLVMTAIKYKSSIRIIYGENSADAKDILEVMALGVYKSAKIIVQIQGEDEVEALEAVKQTLVGYDDLNP